MGYNLFQRRAAGVAEATEFAATELSLPPEPDSLPPAPDSQPAAIDAPTSVIDSAIPDVVTDLGADSLPAPAAEIAVEHSPTISHIGRYALKGLIGQGGLGQVHEAWDPLLSRTVAVKTLQFDVDTPARVSLDALFLNEARAVAGLSHPHIVTVHDAGLSAHGVYIAMERLRGCDLRQRLAQGWQPTPGQAAQLVRRVADALAYAHARNVVHCDIKPANIFLSRRDRPKVLDFGIARVTHGSSLPALAATVAGTPHYLAPEQLQGAAVDGRTDIHALGAVFFELLALRKAFEGESLEQISAAVLGARPPLAHELRAGVSRTLSAIAAKAMAADPAERYATAGEMAAELRRWIERHSGPDSAEAALREASDLAVARRKLQPRRRALLVGAVAAAVGVGALALALREPRRESLPARAAPLSRSVPSQPVAVEAAPSRATTAESGAAMPAAEPAAGTAARAATLTAPRNSAAAPHAVATARPRTTSPSPSGQTRAPAAATAVAGSVGALQFAISPWGQVEVDGVPVGTTPPLSRLTLSEGAHTITVRNDAAPSFTTSVQISADKPVTVRHRFGP